MSETGPAHRTVSLHELHVVGPHGLPVRHRTVQVVRALRSGLASYTFRFDRREASVRVLRGATAREPRPDVSGFTAVELCFARPLRMGETASLEYETSFDWQSVPPPQLRRAARTPVERLEMRVAFTPGRLPADLHWALWDGYGPDARMRAAERVELDDECSAHRFTDEICGVTVGFTWTWPPGEEPRLGG
ncbi:hypothetical protein ACU610_21620 [Geodermatophilus sp. URMC 61]|uniref:hypothetical protein n=1 Tax=Geodermatophilus sp. URMC 61 TaxID=3423411 RepID=UPI00406C493C